MILKNRSVLFMRVFYGFLLSLCLVVSVSALGDPPKQGWSHESEAGVVITSGNTESEAYSAKQKTSYEWSENLFRLTARYLQMRDRDGERARNWDGALRYERALSEVFSIFASHMLESDRFAGIVQRASTDLGGKYFLIKTEIESLSGELGYRYSTEQRVNQDEKINSHKARVYSEWTKKWTPTLSHGVTGEYLPNFSDPVDYMLNFEPSLSVMLNQVLSLKISYQMKYDNKPVPGAKYLDTIYMTTLVAKF
jgi:putative salt-induced outer membrane protein